MNNLCQKIDNNVEFEEKHFKNQRKSRNKPIGLQQKPLTSMHS